MFISRAPANTRSRRVTPKATSLDAALALATPGQVSGAAVVPLMNGIDHVAQLRSRYEHVVAGAMRVESERGSDWVVLQKTPFIRVELAPGGEEIAEELLAAGIDATLREDEAGVLWEKLAFLAPVALTTSALGGPLGDVRDDPWWRARLEGAQAEVVAVRIGRRSRDRRGRATFAPRKGACCDAELDAERRRGRPRTRAGCDRRTDSSRRRAPRRGRARNARARVTRRAARRRRALTGGAGASKAEGREVLSLAVPDDVALWMS